MLKKDSILSLIFQCKIPLILSNTKSKSKSVLVILIISAGGRKVQKQNWQELFLANVQALLCSDWIMPEVIWNCEFPIDSIEVSTLKPIKLFL